MVAKTKKRGLADDVLPRKDAKVAVEQRSLEKAQDNDDGMGEFEDMFEDEFDEESENDVVVNGSDDSDVEMMTNDLLSGEGNAMDSLDANNNEEEEMQVEPETKIFLPGTHLDADEVLVADESTYEMLHSLHVEWPCLSFDVLRDGLGSRTKFPLSAYLVAGSQAPNSSDNKLYVLKMSNMYKTLAVDSEDEPENADDDQDLDEDPILEHRTVPHMGGVNRVRVMPHQESHIVASWSDLGKVHIWDLTMLVRSIDVPGLVVPSKDLKPLHTIKSHGNYEGYAMDWSSRQAGRLLTGGTDNKIFLTSRTPSSSFVTEETPFVGHTSSVEDLQWSPSENNVFASCSADGTVRIWDVRVKKSQIGIRASDTDVNVISWNRSVDYLMASGHDDGSFSIWDLRSFTNAPLALDLPSLRAPTPAANFKWHTDQITSIEWNPNESSVLCVSGGDDQVTLWDLSLEADTDELKVTNGLGEEVQVPAQLLFVHMGQKAVKEIKWHQQIPGVVVSTSETGFNVFKTINS